ncbi:hypothetical protein SD71_18535 [Cohnella kolymensis]|uniref:Uncharacterized protein n=2 Tax=Cohnella kolymensis TaxID=1590652 RepID=A0ABR5A0W4_9BACL|nr:hypothetical protein SD71_18535 [Cohnella kolymensis]
MNLDIKYGLDMQLPDGKLPGFYAQIVKGIADRAPLFDRHKELLIFDTAESYSPVEELLRHYRVPSERITLLVLPSEGTEHGELYEDYVIETRAENAFADLALTAAFSLQSLKPSAEPAPALMQLKEHLIASFTAGDERLHLIDRQLTELAERIAQAYRCTVEWHA